MFIIVKQTVAHKGDLLLKDGSFRKDGVVTDNAGCCPKVIDWDNVYYSEDVTTANTVRDHIEPAALVFMVS